MPENRMCIADLVIYILAVLETSKSEEKVATMVVTRACSREMIIFDVLVDFRRSNCRPEQLNVLKILHLGWLKTGYIQLAQ